MTDFTLRAPEEGVVIKGTPNEVLTALPDGRSGFRPAATSGAPEAFFFLVGASPIIPGGSIGSNAPQNLGAFAAGQKAYITGVIQVSQATIPDSVNLNNFLEVSEDGGPWTGIGNGADLLSSGANTGTITWPCPVVATYEASAAFANVQVRATTANNNVVAVEVQITSSALNVLKLVAP